MTPRWLPSDSPIDVESDTLFGYFSLLIFFFSKMDKSSLQTFQYHLILPMNSRSQGQQRSKDHRPEMFCYFCTWTTTVVCDKSKNRPRHSGDTQDFMNALIASSVFNYLILFHYHITCIFLNTISK